MPKSPRHARYTYRCVPELGLWALVDTLDGHDVTWGREETVKLIMRKWNLRDPYAGKPSPAAPVPDGPRRREWP